MRPLRSWSWAWHPGRWKVYVEINDHSRHRVRLHADWVEPDRLLVWLDLGDGNGDPVWSIDVERTLPRWLADVLGRWVG